VLGYLWAATNRSWEELRDLSLEERAFLYFWVKEVENERLGQIGRLLGTTFSAGEIRSWGKKNGESAEYKNADKVLVPLAFAIRPEFREGLMRMVGSAGMVLPSGYKKAPNEVVVDLSKVSPQEFLDFFGQKKLPKVPTGEG
jgi:hypothetical protein